MPVRASSPRRGGRPRPGRNRLLLVCFGVLALLGVLLPATFNYLLAGDSRQMVVTLVQDATDADRQRLKAECGSLPGVSVVADRGAAQGQARFPVRYRISDSTPAEEIALNACLDRFSALIRGAAIERDRG